MWPRQSALFALIFLLMTVLIACQPGRASPTLQPGEKEVPFETVVLDEEGAVQLTEGSQLFAVTNRDEAVGLQTLITSEAFQQLQQVDFATHSVLAFLRVPGAGCSAFGVTIERLIHKTNTLVIYAKEWKPLAGHGCAETNLSAYHLVKISKTDVNLAEMKLVLQSQVVERGN